MRKIKNLDKSLEKVYTKDKMMEVIGIGGGIGSGKSTVTQFLRNNMYSVYDADEEAREAVKPGEPAMAKLEEYFGSEIINKDGTLNRRLLAQIAFDDEEKTKKLNQILHADIEERIDKKLARHASYLARSRGKLRNLKKAFVTAPLLFESNLPEKCDQTWVIIADQKKRIQRVMDREDITREEVESRLKRQMSDEELKRRADHVIENNGTEDEMISQVKRLLKR